MRELKSIDQIRNHVQKGGRAGEVAADCPMSVVNLMKMCWSQKHRDRPSFDYISQSLLTELSSHHFFLSLPSLSSPAPCKYSSSPPLTSLRLPLHDNLPFSPPFPTATPSCDPNHNINNNNQNNINNNNNINYNNNHEAENEKKEGVNTIGNNVPILLTEVSEKEPILEI